MEIWKDIFGYEGLYQVSNYGNIKRVNSKSLKVSTNVYGYGVVDLCSNNIKKTFRVHRLVAEAFLSNPNNYSCVNHKDENKLNNYVENLEWCTSTYNTKYGNGITKRSKTRSNEIVKIDRNTNEILCKYPSLLLAQLDTGILRTSINNCILGISKTAGGFIWRYAS